MTEKETLILNYSNPKQVYKLARKYYGDDVLITLSTRKNKKYMIYNPESNKWVHFGQMYPPMEDFTKHKDKIRRKRFRDRNYLWAYSDKFSPAFLSYTSLVI
jgi:hypothetical protein